jgi:hypothetical protein
MATIHAGTASLKNTPRRIYMATRSFQADFYTYTTSVDLSTYITSGTLAPVTADASKCPQGRTLRETGKKLYPGANPGVTQYMVGVYDDQTGLRGFINPNSAVFLLLNDDKPEYLPQGSELAGATFSGTNQGQPVFTHGDINAGGNMDVSGNGRIVGNLDVSGNEEVAGHILVGSYVQAAGNLETTDGSIILAEGSAGLFRLPTTLIGATSLNDAATVRSGGFAKLTVSVAGCRTTSRVFFTYSGVNNPGILSAEMIANGSFQIVSNSQTDAGNVQWMIVNAA